MIIGTETLFFAPNLIQWVNCNMGKTWMGAQAVWWLSHRDAKSCSLWSSTKGKCSVNQHCYVSKCAFLQNYAMERCFWGEWAKNIDGQGRAATSDGPVYQFEPVNVWRDCADRPFLTQFNSLQLAWKTTRNADLTSLGWIVSFCFWKKKKEKKKRKAD